MSVTVTDPQLLSELVTAGNQVELVDPAGQSLGLLIRPKPFVDRGVFDPSDPTKHVMTQERLDAILAAAKRVGENPLFADYLQAIEEYRREHNTVDGDEP